MLYMKLLKKGRTSFASTFNSYKLTAKERRASCFLGSSPGFKRNCMVVAVPLFLMLIVSIALPVSFVHSSFHKQHQHPCYISLHLHSNCSLDHFFLFLFKTIYSDPLVPAHPYLHISLQYTSTLLFFNMNSLFPLPGSWFHNLCLSYLNSQVLTSCSFCPDHTNTNSRSTKFWEQSLSSRFQHHNCLCYQEKPAPCGNILVVAYEQFKDVIFLDTQKVLKTESHSFQPATFQKKKKTHKESLQW